MSTYLIYSTISLGILLLVYYAILYNEKTFHFNRVFLLFSLIFSLTIPLVPVGINGVQINFFQFNKTDYKPVPEAPFTITNDAFMEKSDEYPAGVNDENSSSENKLFVLVLYGLYVTVVIFLFIRLLRITHMIQLKARRNPGKVYKGYRVVLLNEDILPHTFLDTIYVNKKQYIKGEIDNKVLLHEITHAKQRHTIDILFLEILKIAFWFNPVIYLYKQAILLNHEFLADEAVIKEGISVKEYQKMILNTLLKSPSHSLASSLNFGLTKKRLFMMTHSSNKPRVILKIALVLPLYITLSLLFGCESVPADSETALKDLTIERTDSEMIRPNGKEIEILINKESEIFINGDYLTLDELQIFLDESKFDISDNINFNVERGAEFQIISHVQKQVRAQIPRQIRYSSIQISD